MKKLHEFTMSKETEVEETITTKNEQGQEVKTVQKTKKRVSHRFFIQKPTRSMYDEADLFFGVKLSEGIQAGLLTRQLLAKRYANDGGAMSEPEKQEYASLYISLFEKQREYEGLIAQAKENERTEEQKKRLSELVKELAILRVKIQEVEFDQISLFDQTAESRARNKTILWWVLMLAHKEDENGKQEFFFGDGNFATRLAKYDELMDTEDDFTIDVINKFMYYISFWYMGRATKSEDFADLDKPQTQTV